VTVYFRRWRATERRGVTDVTRITRTITIDEERVWGDGYKTFGDKQGEAPVMSQNCLQVMCSVEAAAPIPPPNIYTTNLPSSIWHQMRVYVYIRTYMHTCRSCMKT
jgi:hypothetical protein